MTRNEGVTDQNFLTYQDFLAAGITYRRVHYWSERGYLHPVAPSPGGGRAMQWPVGELEVAQVMLLLVDGLEMSPARAADIARAGGYETADEHTRVTLVVESLHGPGWG